tara:strand:- start:182 stop:397 length:216 start_codon:yes stop_codon:yes gene_type:complete
MYYTTAKNNLLGHDKHNNLKLQASDEWRETKGMSFALHKQIEKEINQRSSPTYSGLTDIKIKLYMARSRGQ